MFKLADPDAIYNHPVTINVPVGDGKTTPQDFTAQFKLLPAEAVKKTMVNDVTFAATVLFGWDGIADHTGKPLPFSDTNRDNLAQIGYFSMGIANAYLEFSSGLPVKN